MEKFTTEGTALLASGGVYLRRPDRRDKPGGSLLSLKLAPSNAFG
jgi:hypothetical protein